jgi:hypothetical protein
MRATDGYVPQPLAPRLYDQRHGYFIPPDYLERSNSYAIWSQTDDGQEWMARRGLVSTIALPWRTNFSLKPQRVDDVES